MPEGREQPERSPFARAVATSDKRMDELEARATQLERRVDEERSERIHWWHEQGRQQARAEFAEHLLAIYREALGVLTDFVDGKLTQAQARSALQALPTPTSSVERDGA